MQQILNFIFSEAGMGLIATFVAPLVAKLVVSLVRRRRIALAGYYAFHIVEDLKSEMEEDGKSINAVEKVVAGLKAADDWMKSQGWRPLKPGEVDAVKLQFKALHGEDKVDVAKAEAAAIAAAKITASPS